MKTIYLLLLILLVPVTFHAQRTLTGLWTGSRSNDSTTIRKDQSFEIALTQYKQKVYGYSRSAFIVNDSLFFVVKRVKGTIDGNVCEIHDDEMISTNFHGRQDKGVKVTTTFRMSQEDTTWHLDGEWKTNKTKNYYSISGKIELKSESNLDNSKIFPHLEELKIADDVAFYKEIKAPPVVKQKDPVPAIAQTTKKTEATKQNKIENKEPVQKPEQPIVKKSDEAVARTSDLPMKKSEPQQKPAQPENKTAETIKPAPQTTPEKVAANPAPVNSVPEKSASVVDQPVNNTPSKPVVVSTPTNNTPVAAARSLDPIPKAVAAAEVATRITLPPQTVTFKSDSLELAIYDNGEIDGDTVSVLLNGEIILAKQGLKMSAIKKTIYIPADTDEITLLLYAENLGKYPPNTGLLTVHDGEDVYQVRFSADLKQNASVIFKRKRN
jgi:hypothetical protein